MMDGSGDGGLSYTYILTAKKAQYRAIMSHISSQYHEVGGHYTAIYQDDCFNNYIHICGQCVVKLTTLVLTDYLIAGGMSKSLILY